MKVNLTYEEVSAAAMVGIRRVFNSIDRFNPLDVVRKAAQGESRSNWDSHIDGALGECAVAKAVGLYWNPNVNVFKGPDVANLHVRQTRLDYGSLVIRTDDPDGLYVLVVGSLADYRIAGWIDSRKGKVDDFWREDRGSPYSWFIPQASLRSIRELVEV